MAALLADIPVRPLQQWSEIVAENAVGAAPDLLNHPEVWSGTKRGISMASQNGAALTTMGWCLRWIPAALKACSTVLPADLTARSLLQV